MPRSVQKGYGVHKYVDERRVAVELVIPNSLTKNVTDEWGDAGKAWLQRLPDLLLECRDLWHLQLHQSSFPLSYNYVTEVTLDDGKNAILKVGFPQDELFNEMKLLQLLKGRCTAKLLCADEKRGALLLERIEPGTALTSMQLKDDEQATSIAAEVLKGFPIAVPEGFVFPTISDWGKAFQQLP